MEKSQHRILWEHVEHRMKLLSKLEKYVPDELVADVNTTRTLLHGCYHQIMRSSEYDLVYGFEMRILFRTASDAILDLASQVKVGLHPTKRRLLGIEGIIASLEQEIWTNEVAVGYSD